MSWLLSDAEGEALLALARAAIAERLVAMGTLEAVRKTTTITPALCALRACFVTLDAPGEDGLLRLRGCVGSTDARLAAHEAVVESARQAAFSDPRFAPVTREELPVLVLSVSLLTPMIAVEASAVVVGRDGVLLACDGHEALFLPEVAEHHGWTRDELLRQLARKAGLPSDAWRRGRLSRFQTERFGENGSGAARIRRS